MNHIVRIWKKIRKEIRKENWKALLSIGILILLIILLTKGCGKNPKAPQNSFKIAYDNTWYPLQITDKDKNMVAFSTELLIDIADQESFRVNLISTSPDAILEGLDNGSFDAILSGLEPNVMQRHYYTFSNPYFLVGPVLVVSQDSNIHSYAEMAGKAVGVKEGASLLFNVPQPAEMTVYPYAYILAAFADLDKGLIDGVILDLLPAYAYTTGYYAGRLRIASAPLNNAGIRLVTKQSLTSKRLISRFNDGLFDLKESGDYAKLLQRWNLYQTKLSELNK